MTNKNCKAIYSAFWHQSVHTEAESRSQTAQTRSQQRPGTGCTGCLKAKRCRDMGRKTKQTSQPCPLPTRRNLTPHVLLIASTLVFLKINPLCKRKYQAHCSVNLNNKVKHSFCCSKLSHAEFKPFSKKSAKSLYFKKH